MAGGLRAGRGRRGDGLRGARGLQRLEAHAYHASCQSSRRTSISRRRPFDWSRRRRPAASLWWSRSALVPRFSRSRPTTASRPRARAPVAMRGYTAPPVPRTVTRKHCDRSELFLVCLCKTKSRVQNQALGTNSRVTAPCGARRGSEAHARSSRGHSGCGSRNHGVRRASGEQEQRAGSSCRRHTKRERRQETTAKALANHVRHPRHALGGRRRPLRRRPRGRHDRAPTPRPRRGGLHDGLDVPRLGEGHLQDRQGHGHG